MKYKDKVVQWRITIEGIDQYMKPVVYIRGAITKEMLDIANFPIHEMEFKRLWRQLMEKAEEELEAKEVSDGK